MSKVNLIDRLPDAFDPMRGDAIPHGLVGSKIVRIGTLPERNHVEGGGLVLELISPEAFGKRRIVFAFNELGMWVETDSIIPSNSD